MLPIPNKSLLNLHVTSFIFINPNSSLAAIENEPLKQVAFVLESDGSLRFIAILVFSTTMSLIKTCKMHITRKQVKLVQ